MSENKNTKKPPSPQKPRRVYGDEQDVITEVVRSVKRDSAQRNAPPPRKNTAKRPASNGSKPRSTAAPSVQSNSWSRRMQARVSHTADALKRFQVPTIALIVLAIVISGLFWDGQNIDVEQQSVTIYGLSDDLKGFTILHLSDLNSANFGENQAQLMRKISSLSYDAVVLTGDMVGAKNDPNRLYDLLEALPSSVPVYFIPGDSDPGPFVSHAREITGSLNELVLENWILGAMARGAIYVDRPVQLKVKGAKIWFSPADMLNTNLTETRTVFREVNAQQEEGVINGIRVDYDALPFTSYRNALYEEAYKTALSMNESDLHISLAHIPPTEEYVRSSEAGIFNNDGDAIQIIKPDLILAGHYCNGVVNLPILGAFHVSSNTLPRKGWFPSSQSISGISNIGDTILHITKGLGTDSSMPLLFSRFLNHPQISLITLTGELPESMLN